MTEVAKDERRLAIGPVVDDSPELPFMSVVKKGRVWKVVWTHEIDVFALDWNVVQEVKVGELNPILLDCLWIISCPNLGED